MHACTYTYTRTYIYLDVDETNEQPTAARSHLLNNPGFLALMEDPELGKHLPLLNMIIPLYNEQAAGAATSALQVFGVPTRYWRHMHHTVLLVVVHFVFSIRYAEEMLCWIHF